MRLANTLSNRHHAHTHPSFVDMLLAAAAMPATLLRNMADHFSHRIDSWGETVPSNAAIAVATVADPRDLRRTASAMRRAWHPDVEVFRRDGMMVLRAEVPGFAASDIAVRLERDQLTISGIHPSRGDADVYFGPEYHRHAFHRAIPVLETTDATQCSAAFRDGVLEITLPLPVLDAVPGTAIPVSA